MSKLSDQVNDLFERDQWAEARKLLSVALKAAPNDHWLLARLATTFYEELNYKKALSYAKRAYRAQPDCPLVWWELAGAMSALEDYEGAKKLYARLAFGMKEQLKPGAKTIAEHTCGEGLAHTMGLVVDSLFRLGVCEEALGNKKEAIKRYCGYLSVASLGVETIYNPEDVKARAKRLDRRLWATLSQEEILEELSFQENGVIPRAS